MPRTRTTVFTYQCDGPPDGICPNWQDLQLHYDRAGDADQVAVQVGWTMSDSRVMCPLCTRHTEAA